MSLKLTIKVVAFFLGHPVYPTQSLAHYIYIKNSKLYCNLNSTILFGPYHAPSAHSGDNEIGIFFGFIPASKILLTWTEPTLKGNIK